MMVEGPLHGGRHSRKHEGYDPSCPEQDYPTGLRDLPGRNSGDYDAEDYSENSGDGKDPIGPFIGLWSGDKE